MVQVSVIYLSGKKAFTGSYIRRKFVDSLRLHIKGGSGGMGYPKYGGIGGKGGDVFVEAKEDVTLRLLCKTYPNKRITGCHGGNSKSYRILGEHGKDVIVEVPVGITVYTDNGNKLGSIDKVGDRVLVAKGGRGGCLENQFSGQAGQAHSITLDLKLIADVGLVGFPNAGKSTLLNAVSRARAKTANYPFTTLTPQLGIIEYDDLRQISVADLPGLIEGAHANTGLGHKFLKHIERTKILLFMVDINGFQLKPQTMPRSALETVVFLNKEVELYQEELVEKCAILAINKMDSKHSEQKLVKLLDDVKNIKDITSSWPSRNVPSKFIKFEHIITISAKTGEGINILKTKLRKVIDFYDDEKRENVQIRNLDILTRKKANVVQVL